MSGDAWLTLLVFGATFFLPLGMFAWIADLGGRRDDDDGEARPYDWRRDGL